MPTYWAHVEPLLVEAVKRSNGRYSTDWVWKSVHTGDVQLWAVLGDGIGSAAVSQISIYPESRWLTVLFAGGDLEQIKQQKSTIEDYAKSIGCVGVEWFGRAGWKRVFTDYQTIWSGMEKRLT